MIAGQREFDRVVGDTSAVARVVHPFAIPSLSTECLHPSSSGAFELATPLSRLAQVLLPHKRRANAWPALTPKYTHLVASPAWGVVSLLHRFGSDPHRHAKRAILPDAYISTRAYAA